MYDNFADGLVTADEIEFMLTNNGRFALDDSASLKKTSSECYFGTLGPGEVGMGFADFPRSEPGITDCTSCEYMAALKHTWNKTRDPAAKPQLPEVPESHLLCAILPALSPCHLTTPSPTAS